MRALAPLRGFPAPRARRVACAWRGRPPAAGMAPPWGSGRAVPGGVPRRGKARPEPHGGKIHAFATLVTG